MSNLLWPKTFCPRQSTFFPHFNKNVIYGLAIRTAFPHCCPERTWSFLILFSDSGLVDLISSETCKNRTGFWREAVGISGYPPESDSSRHDRAINSTKNISDETDDAISCAMSPPEPAESTHCYKKNRYKFLSHSYQLRFVVIGV